MELDCSKVKMVFSWRFHVILRSWLYYLRILCLKKKKLSSDCKKVVPCPVQVYFQWSINTSCFQKMIIDLEDYIFGIVGISCYIYCTLLLVHSMGTKFWMAIKCISCQWRFFFLRPIWLILFIYFQIIPLACYS